MEDLPPAGFKSWPQSENLRCPSHALLTADAMLAILQAEQQRPWLPTMSGPRGGASSYPVLGSPSKPVWFSYYAMSSDPAFISNKGDNLASIHLILFLIPS